MATPSKERNILSLLKHWDRGFESHSRHACLSAFLLYSFCPVQIAGLRQADPPSKESYRLSIRFIITDYSDGRQAGQ
jgi:hypothetical protein